MKYKINLIRKKQESFFDSLIFFLLNYLRYILVITQIIVIAVFFYKFKVDQEIIDLKESVDQKKEIVSISQPLIKEAKALDLKMGYANKIITYQTKFGSTLVYFLGRFPESLWLTSLKITGDSIEAVGTGADANVIRFFYERLKKEKKFKKIDLLNVSKNMSGFSFLLKLSNFQ